MPHLLLHSFSLLLYVEVEVVLYLLCHMFVFAFLYYPLNSFPDIQSFASVSVVGSRSLIPLQSLTLSDPSFYYSSLYKSYKTFSLNEPF